jgi:RNA polymerase sigma-70 factor, ECF subfamily
MPDISPEKTKEFIEAYDGYVDAIFRHIYFRVFNKDLAKDLMQETFARTWEYLCKGKEVKSLKSFLYKVANNLIIDEYRKKRELSLDSLQMKGFDVEGVNEERIIREVENEHALRIIRNLEAHHQEVIIMRFIDDLSIREIAEIIGQSENVVSVRINRGLKEVRKLLRL